MSSRSPPRHSSPRRRERSDEKHTPGKIFLGGVSFNSTSETLQQHFSRYGEVTDAIVMRDGVGKSRGFGFVTFKDPAVVDQVIKDTHVIDGRQLELKLARTREEMANRVIPSKKLFVGGLHADTTASEFRKHFEEFGPLSDNVIMVDSHNQPRGFGFVTYVNPEDAEKALDGREHIIHGRSVDVKRPEPRREERLGGAQDVRGQFSSFREDEQRSGRDYPPPPRGDYRDPYARDPYPRDPYARDPRDRDHDRDYSRSTRDARDYRDHSRDYPPPPAPGPYGGPAPYPPAAPAPSPYGPNPYSPAAPAPYYDSRTPPAPAPSPYAPATPAPAPAPTADPYATLTAVYSALASLTGAATAPPAAAPAPTSGPRQLDASTLAALYGLGAPANGAPAAAPAPAPYPPAGYAQPPPAAYPPYGAPAGQAGPVTAYSQYRDSRAERAYHPYQR
ncbi:putative heterogeneous nuclear ribonucleoprotein 1 [Paratrimastix pyriformis]|uniref:Heterogeneous nuclear ribonucleoprotein 1 n=1 Tax=Paratrimastix pyriformis TaxID=342808 RepID=A0ABQ8UCA9_9EUKA|nr:putative heterogeneous nuclear ribonucleoprotein 1 [Paratrimastix pyriformis]